MIEILIKRTDRQPHSVGLLLFSIVITVIIFLNAVSYMISKSNPDFALLINPLNSDARINILTTGLSKKTNPSKLKTLEQIANNSIRLEPMDARFFSLLGTLREMGGHNQEAQGLYQHALQLLPTEIQALTRRFVHNVNHNKYAQAVTIAAIIARRWNQHWDLISSYLTFLLEDEEAYEEALVQFANHDNDKYLLVSSLINDTKSLDIGYRLISDWHSKGENGLGYLVNYLTGKLISKDQAAKAFRLFRLTLDDKQKQQAAYIFNGNFALKASGNLFDWKIIKQSGLAMELIPNWKTGKGSENDEGGILQIRFLNNPIRLSAILQYLKLPAADFKLNLVYSASTLISPKRVKLAVECAKSNIILATVEFLPGNVRSQQLQANIKVPQDNCDLQQIRILNDNLVESWSNRYSGTLSIHKVSLELSGP